LSRSPEAFDLEYSDPCSSKGCDSKTVSTNFPKSNHHRLLSTRPALRPTQTPIQWIQSALPLGVKWSGREADRSHPSSADVKECVELYFHSPSMHSVGGARLKHRDKFTLTYSVIAVTWIRPHTFCLLLQLQNGSQPYASLICS